MASFFRRPSSRLLLALGALAGLGLGLGLWLRAKRMTGDAERVLVAAPSDAWLIVTVDVPALWPLLEPAIGSGGGLAGASQIAGLGPVSKACGFEPLEHVRQLMVVLPEAGEAGQQRDFGVAFAGDFTADALEACARKAIAASGGHAVRRTRGDFALVGDGDQANPASASLASRPGGPFLVGRGAWLEAMIDAVDGKVPHSSPPHDALRQLLASRSAASSPPGLLLTALLPKGLRDRLQTETSRAEGQGAFSGVLGVSELGLGVTAHGPATSPTATTDFDVELRCETARACDDVKALIEHARLALSGDFRARLLGLGPLIDGLSCSRSTVSTVEGNVEALAVRTHAPTGDLARTLVRARETWARGAPAAAGEGDASPSPPAPPSPPLRPQGPASPEGRGDAGAEGRGSERDPNRQPRIGAL